MPGSHSLIGTRSTTLLVIGLSAFVDVVLRAILLASGIRVEVVTAVVSLTTLAIGQAGLGLAAWLADWVFLSAFVFGILPFVFPPRLRETIGIPRVRASATATVVAVGLVLQAGLWAISPHGFRILLPGTPLAGSGRTWLLVAVLLGVGVLVTAVAVRLSSRDATLTSSAATLLDAWTPFREIHHIGPRQLLLAGGLVGLVLFLSGLFTVFVALLSPLPEALVLVWGGTVAVGRRWGRPDTLSVPAPPDVESRFAVSIAAVTDSPKGAACGILLLLGTLPFLTFAGPMALFVLALVVVIPVDLVTEGIGPTLVFLDSLYLATAGVVSGVYVLWYYSRLLERLPLFLQTWPDISPRDRVTRREWPDHQALVTRPPGLLVPPLFVIFVLLVGVPATGFDREHGVFAIPPSYLLAATVGLGLVAASVYVTRRRGPQPALSDAFALPAAVSVELTVVLFVIFEQLDSAPAVLEAVVSLSPPPVGALADLVTIGLGVGFAVGLVFTVPDVWEQRYRGTRFRLVPGGYVLAIGGLSGLIVPFPWSYFSGIVALVGSLLLTVEGTRLLPCGGLYGDEGVRGTVVWLGYLAVAAVVAGGTAFVELLPGSVRMVSLYLGLLLGLLIVVYPTSVAGRVLLGKWLG